MSEVKKQALEISGGKASEAEGTASANVLGQLCAWMLEKQPGGQGRALTFTWSMMGNH